MKQIALRIFGLLLLFSPLFSSAYNVGDYGCYAIAGSGAVTWNAGNCWATWNGASWTQTLSFPSSANDVYILNGYTMTLDGQGFSNSLIVENGAILYVNGATNTYVDVYGPALTCNGIIGNGATYDGIGFDIDGNSCTISGGGTFTATHIREINSSGNTTNLTIQMNTTLVFGPTSGGYKNSSIYNHSNNTIFNVNFAAGYTTNFAAYSAGNTTNMSIAGSDGTQTLRGGTITINGTVIISGYAILTTASTTNSYLCSWIINNGGLLQTNDIYTNVSGTGSGAGGHNLTINNGGKMQITSTPFASIFYTVNNTYTLNSGSTVEYDGAGAQAIDNNLTYANLILSGSGNKTAAGTLNIKGDLTISTPAVLIPNTAINVGGNWNDYGTAGFTETGSTVTFNGNGSQAITVPNGENFINLIINKGGGSIYLDSASKSKVTIGSPGILTLTSGIIYGDTSNTGANYVLISNGAGVTGANNSSFVYGRVSRAGNTNFAFPVGKGSEYRPDSISNLSGTATIISQYFKQNPYYGVPTVYDTSKKTLPIDHVSGAEYWTIVSASTITADLTLQWDTYSGGVTDTANLIIADQLPPANWVSFGGGHGITTGTLAQGTLSTLTTGTLTSGKLVAYTFASQDTDPNNPLPVSLISFEAQVQPHDVLLQWTTDAEINNNYFTIEKTSDGVAFEVVGKVDGAGNSTVVRNYGFIDASPYPGVSYYRLKQTDYDGHYTYSKIIAVNYDKQELPMIKLFPNPASDLAYINVSWKYISVMKDKIYILHIFDINGRETVPQQSFNFSYGMLQALDVSALPKGVYIIQLSADTDIQQTSLIKE